MELYGYLASILIGVSLGLIGGGGSILTVPVLVYLFGTDPVLATAYSLFIVGATSAVGSVSFFKKGLVDIKKALLFGLPSVAAVFVTRSFLVPAIPDELFRIGTVTITKGALLMTLFAILMLLASYSMIRKKKAPVAVAAGVREFSVAGLMLKGIAIGVVTAFIGAGGGFLIIPVLVNLLHLDMKKAVGTSLFIIAINSLLGFVFSLSHIQVQWPLVLTVAGIAIAGILLGSWLSTKIDGKKLKPAFGWFVLAMGVYILLRQIM